MKKNVQVQRSLCGLAGLCVTAALAMGGCGGLVDEQADQLFHERIGNMSITVFPAFVRDGEEHRYSVSAARDIAAFLTDEKLAPAGVSDAEVPVTSKWGMNQARMFRDSLADFSAYVKEHPIETDYALLPEYLFGGRGAVGGVHVYLVGADGVCAYAVLLNSHHEAFNDVNPQTVPDCTRLVLNVLRDELKPAAEKSQGEQPKAAVLGPDSSVTVFPVSLAGRPMKDVADVVGVMLEQEGMPNIWTTETRFESPAGASLSELAAGFSEFVQEHAIDTDFALYAEFLGKPGNGVREVRAVLVDKRGTIMWTDSQTPDDADFKRIKPQNPMTCCVLLNERLKPRFKLTAATRAAAEKGRMAALWAAKSGTPTEEEREKMKARQAAFRQLGRAARLAVYPPQVNQELDATCAEHLARLIEDPGLYRTLRMPPHQAFEIAPNRNEQKRLWDLARACRAYVRENPPVTEYALFAEYTIRPSDQQVWSVHFVVCDRTGEWVIVDFQNNHHTDFQAINPQTRADCDRLVAKRLTGYL